MTSLLDSILALANLIERHYILHSALDLLREKGAWGQALRMLEKELFDDTLKMVVAMRDILSHEQYSNVDITILELDRLQVAIDEEARILQAEIDRRKQLRDGKE